jgi:hypothetical protein
MMRISFQSYYQLSTVGLDAVNEYNLYAKQEYERITQLNKSTDIRFSQMILVSRLSIVLIFNKNSKNFA